MTPAPSRGSGPSPSSRGLRAAVERRSIPVLLALQRAPRLTVPAVAAVLAVVGLAVDGPLGAVALVVLTLILAWFSYLSWPRQGGVDRALRVLVLLALVGALAQRALT